MREFMLIKVIKFVFVTIMLLVLSCTTLANLVAWDGVEQLDVNLQTGSPTIDSYNSVMTALDLLPAALSATVSGDLELVTSISFMLMTDDYEFPAGAHAILTDTTTENQNPTAILVTDKPGTYKVKLEISDGSNTYSKTAEVVVYADSCQARKETSEGWTANYFDLDGNCLVDIVDFVEFAAQWMNGTSLIEAETFDPILNDGENIQYVIIEGGGPDQGPGRNVTQNFNEIIAEFGPVVAGKSRMYASGVQQIRILTRSTAVIRERVESVLILADNLGVPIWLHIDPIYAWGANTETDPADAPRIKYWENERMREWREFPVGDQLPTYIPRKWFNWGPWCSPVSASPSLGSAEFVDFAREQLRVGVLEPLRVYLEKWKNEGRAYLFAGINIGWETNITYYSSTKLNSSIVVEYPTYLAGLQVDPGLIGVSSQFGYASLHWNGWTQVSLQNAANLEGLSYTEKLNNELYKYIHDYMESLAMECSNIGIGPGKVYTHIVALASVPSHTVNTIYPPIWTAVNPYSTPGFTMFNRGGAKYNMVSLKDKIAAAPGSRNQKFACIETYLTNGGTEYITDASAFKDEIETMFIDGATVMCFYGSCPVSQRMPEKGADAIRMWLEE